MNHFYVYVIELRSKSPSMKKPDMYVGSSAFSPQIRFQKHMSGERSSSRHVRKRGLRLRPDLYQSFNPLSSREEAKAAEQKLRKILERKGYRVFGSCSPRQTPECWL